ncbi:MAG: YggS family pyridoxal phosphate-dependent enzyme [Burkholderiaceae bacterium]
MTNIAQNIAAVHQRIQLSCHKAGRNSDDVTLLAVSKTVSPEAIKLAIAAGQRDFGENYIAEGVEKIAALAVETAQYGLQWHCIGPVQSNKTRLVAQHFDWVHTIDRLKIAERLNEQRPAEAKRLQVCIQVNIDNSPSKAGVTPNEVLALAQEIAKLPRLQLRGIMAIPDIPDTLVNGVIDFAINNIANKAVFTPARAVLDQLNALNYGLDTLSIGMSADLEPAIQAGSTMVRVGSAIFGARN